MTDLEKGDLITLNLKSAAGNGPIITENYTIKLFLRQIEGAQPYLLPITVSYRECEVVEYEAPQVADQTFLYQSPAPLVLYFSFDQGDCSYKETVQAFLVKDEELTDLPSFIQLSAKEQSLTVTRSNSLAALGEYSIELRSTLDNTIRSTNSTRFTINVVN